MGTLRLISGWMSRLVWLAPALCVVAAVGVGLIARESPPAVAAPLRVGAVTGADAMAAMDTSGLMPPPPVDAEPYTVSVALFNGDGGIKKRWLWLPEGTSIDAQRRPDGSVVLDVPLGAQLWKEFRLGTDQGDVLIERRMVEHVAGDGPAAWRFVAAYTLGDRATGQPGQAVRTDSAEFQNLVYGFDEWLPVQETEESTQVSLIESDGNQLEYVYPGARNCAVCHGGASSTSGDGSEPVFVFGVHPDNLDADSLGRLVARGWLTGSAVADVVPVPPVGPGGGQQDALTTQLVGVLRNNCASCHSSSRYAAASGTSFVLDPNRDYTTAELADALSEVAVMSGDRGLPIVEPGDPSRSEIMLRLLGLDGRRRMPPIEGGVPAHYDDLIDLMERWIRGLPVDPHGSGQ